MIVAYGSSPVALLIVDGVSENNLKNVFCLHGGPMSFSQIAAASETIYLIQMSALYQR